MGEVAQGTWGGHLGRGPQSCLLLCRGLRLLLLALCLEVTAEEAWRLPGASAFPATHSTLG